MSLNNKVVIITGGGSGIGAATAQSFVEAGARVVLNRRSEKKLRKTASAIDPSGEKAQDLCGHSTRSPQRPAVVHQRQKAAYMH